MLYRTTSLYPVTSSTPLLSSLDIGAREPFLVGDIRVFPNFSFPTVASLTIQRIHDAETLKTWLRVMTVGSEIPEEGFALLVKPGFTDDPSFHFYLGMFTDKPIATSLLYLGGGVTGIYNVTTLPEVRHQWIGSALTVAPLLQARTLGYLIGTLQSSPMGLNLYRHLGFSEYCTFQAYFWQGANEARAEYQT